MDSTLIGCRVIGVDFNERMCFLAKENVLKNRKAKEIPRYMQLFFYYPSDEYISFLMSVSEICFIDEIDCQDLFEGENNRERIVIFEML